MDKDEAWSTWVENNYKLKRNNNNDDNKASVDYNEISIAQVEEYEVIKI